MSNQLMMMGAGNSGAGGGGITVPTPSVYYPFNDSTADESGNGIDWTNEFGPTYPAGKFGTCANNASLSRTEQQMFSGGTGTGNWSISLWFKSTASNDNIQITIATNATLQFRVQGDEGGYFCILGGAAIDGPRNIYTSGDEVWHHFALTVDSGVLVTYLDGEAGAPANVSAATNEFTATDGIALTVSAHNNLDDLVVIPATLTQDQITELAEGTQPYGDYDWT